MSDIETLFIECSECQGKPGAARLCEDCIERRTEHLKTGKCHLPKTAKRCAVLRCGNYTHHGDFVGLLCAPCHSFISTGEGLHSQARRNELERKKEEEERRNRATGESVDRMRGWCAEGLGMQVGSLGGLEGSIVALAAEARTQRRRARRLEAEVHSLKCFKQEVEEALNSGDGTYRP